VNGDVPAVTAPIVIVPLALPQVEFVELKTTFVGPPEFDTVVVTEKVQLLASLIVTL
jgi:hypothetical protein